MCFHILHVPVRIFRILLSIRLLILRMFFIPFLDRDLIPPGEIVGIVCPPLLVQPSFQLLAAGLCSARLLSLFESRVRARPPLTNTTRLLI